MLRRHSGLDSTTEPAADCEASRTGMLSSPRLLQQRQLGLEAQHLRVQARDLRAHRRSLSGQVLVHNGLRQDKPGLKAMRGLVSMGMSSGPSCVTNASRTSATHASPEHHISSQSQPHSRRVLGIASAHKCSVSTPPLYRYQGVQDQARITLLRMFLARCAKRSVLSVSERQPAAGLTLAIMMVFELPPSESCATLACVSCCPLLQEYTTWTLVK